MENIIQDELEKTMSVVLNTNAQQENTFFTINSQKASEILGVNRTRLSQLTSRGLFPYERRKVEARSRLFYRLNDLLNYQRKSSFGNLHPAQKNEKDRHPCYDDPVPLMLPEGSEYSSLDTGSDVKNEKNIRSNRSFSSALFFSKNKTVHRTPRALQKVLELKANNEARAQNDKIYTVVTELEKKLDQMTAVIAKLEHEISLLNARELNKKLNKKLNRKKIVTYR